MEIPFYRFHWCFICSMLLQTFVRKGCVHSGALTPFTSPRMLVDPIAHLSVFWCECICIELHPMRVYIRVSSDTMVARIQIYSIVFAVALLVICSALRRTLVGNVHTISPVAHRFRSPLREDVPNVQQAC